MFLFRVKHKLKLRKKPLRKNHIVLSHVINSLELNGLPTMSNLPAESLVRKAYGKITYTYSGITIRWFLSFSMKVSIVINAYVVKTSQQTRRLRYGVVTVLGLASRQN